MMPPLTATLLTLTDAPPALAVFVNVTVCVPELTAGRERDRSGLGEIDTVAGAMLVPVSATGLPVIVAPVAATVAERG